MASDDFDILIGSDNTIHLRGLNNGGTPPSYYNNATVVATLYDSAGREVAGQSWPTTLTYVPSSNGDYDGTLQDDLAIGERSGYTLVITATISPDLVRTFRRSGRGIWG